MKKLISVTGLSLLLSTTLFAKWAMIPLDELVADTDLIVIGTLHSASENSEYEGKGYIRVEQVITKGVNTLDGRPLVAGDNLKLTWLGNWACAMGMHLRWENQRGIWLLTIGKDGTVKAGYPGRFRQIDDFREIQALLHRKQLKKAGQVDISSWDHAHERSIRPVGQVATIDAVDVSPSDDHSPSAAVLTALFSLGLYWALYRSRFRIR